MICRTNSGETRVIRRNIFSFKPNSLLKIFLFFSRYCLEKLYRGSFSCAFSSRNLGCSKKIRFICAYIQMRLPILPICNLHSPCYPRCLESIILFPFFVREVSLVPSPPFPSSILVPRWNISSCNLCLPICRPSLSPSLFLPSLSCLFCLYGLSSVWKHEIKRRIEGGCALLRTE